MAAKKKKGARPHNAPWTDRFSEAVDELGAVAVGRIVGKPWQSVAAWARDSSKIPRRMRNRLETDTDTHLTTTMKRLRYMRRRSQKAKVSQRTRDKYFRDFIALASKRTYTAKDNYKIVQILLNLKIDPHRPESYLRDA